MKSRELHRAVGQGWCTVCRKAGVTSQEGLNRVGSRTSGRTVGERNVRELNDKGNYYINLYPNQNSSFKKGGAV